VHRRLIGESLTTELALDRLTKEHPDERDTCIRADARALELCSKVDDGTSAGIRASTSPPKE